MGYARVGPTQLPNDLWAWQFLSWGSGWNKLTLRPVGNPSAYEAIGVSIGCASDDFLLPIGQPVSFELKAKNYSAKTQVGTFSFQICDYLTHDVVAERVTPFQLRAGDTTAIPTQIAFDRPGVFRGRAKVEDERGKSRAVEWVFTHDFANYAPQPRRPSDFDTFWEETLNELADIPMAAKLTPDGPNYCGMWIAVHGLPVELDFESRPDDPAAWNYWTYGIESPRTSMWRTICASMVRAVDFLCSRPEVDVNRIMASGGSQGGGLTLVLAGLDQRICFAAPAHSGLCRLDWTVQYKPGFWPFDMSAKPARQTESQFLHALSYFDAANFTPRIRCPVVAEVSLLDTVTASGNQIAALTAIRPGLLELICDPWHSHASSPRGARLRAEAINRWLEGEARVRNPIKPLQRRANKGSMTTD